MARMEQVNPVIQEFKKKYAESHIHEISLGIYINPMSVSVNAPYLIKEESKWNNVFGL